MNTAVYGALIFLLALTVAASGLGLSSTLSIGIALGLAAAKALLIAVYYMKLRTAPASFRLAGLMAVLWISLLMLITWGDYLTRFGFGVLGK